MLPFSVRDDDPFIVFRALQEIAKRSRGHDVIDLSRGDPGYGFTPSRAGREFASFVLFLDSVLNVDAKERFVAQESDTEKLWTRIKEATAKVYQAQSGEKMMQLLRTFLDAAKNAAAQEGTSWTDADILAELFLSSRMSGGTYLHPQGEKLSRIIVAAWHRKELGVNVTSSDLILTNGASHAIGALFKALGEEGCGYLREGDTVCIASPVYAPYNRILEERKLNVVTFSIDPLTGHCDSTPILQYSGTPKVLFLINPHNPTGFSLAESELRALAEIARERDMLLITDEVYLSFFPEKQSMLQFAPERTIAINARSKIERSTGIRFGEIIMLKEAREPIAGMLGLKDSAALERLLLCAKAPGRAGGEFQHTTFVPGPSQLLGIAHMVLGGEERHTYFEALRENQTMFQKELGLPHHGNLYYVIFDLHALPGCRMKHLSMEEMLTALAEAGVIYLPAYRFFSPQERGKPGALTSVRASLVNASAERLREAARRTKEVLC